MVMEKSWNLVISHGILPLNFTKFVLFFVTAKKFSSNQESLHFRTFSKKCCKCKIVKRDGHGKSRKGHGRIFCEVCGNSE